jgi:hypothetical protein
MIPQRWLGDVGQFRTVPQTLPLQTGFSCGQTDRQRWLALNFPSSHQDRLLPLHRPYGRRQRRSSGKPATDPPLCRSLWARSPRGEASQCFFRASRRGSERSPLYLSGMCCTGVGSSGMTVLSSKRSPSDGIGSLSHCDPHLTKAILISSCWPKVLFSSTLSLPDCHQGPSGEYCPHRMANCFVMAKKTIKSKGFHRGRSCALLVLNMYTKVTIMKKAKSRKACIDLIVQSC